MCLQAHTTNRCSRTVNHKQATSFHHRHQGNMGTSCPVADIYNWSVNLRDYHCILQPCSLPILYIYMQHLKGVYILMVPTDEVDLWSKLQISSISSTLLWFIRHPWRVAQEFLSSNTLISTCLLYNWYSCCWHAQKLMTGWLHWFFCA